MDHDASATLRKGAGRNAPEVDAAAAIVGPLLTRYNRRLFRLARGILANSEEAEDAVQEAYVRALSNLDQLRDRASLGAWLARITVNEALARRRRRHDNVPLEEVSERAAVGATEGTVIVGPFGRRNPEEKAVQGEIRGLLEHAIDALPMHFRSVFVACDIEGLSAAEAAAALGLYQVTVKTRLFRARRLLRRKLDASLIAALAGAFPCAGARCERITAGVLARLAAGHHLPAPPRERGDKA